MTFKIFEDDKIRLESYIADNASKPGVVYGAMIGATAVAVAELTIFATFTIATSANVGIVASAYAAYQHTYNPSSQYAELSLPEAAATGLYSACIKPIVLGAEAGGFIGGKVAEVLEPVFHLQASNLFDLDINWA
jgi:hypothetical protein